MTAIEAALRVLLEAGSTVELRVPKAGRARVISGYFDDPAAMARAAARLDGRHPGVYFTANPVKPALLARANNRVVERAELTTGDHDVARRRWLPIDLDPVRPAGVSATDAEHQAALAKASEIAAFLAGRGWPAPVLADSGNGTYVLCRIDLANDDASRELLHRCLEALALRFDDQATHVDTTMFNAARIIRVPGTRNAKGDSTPDRPHRTARLLEVPDPLEVVTVEQLAALAAILPEPEPSSQNGGRRGEQPAASTWRRSSPSTWTSTTMGHGSRAATAGYSACAHSMPTTRPWRRSWPVVPAARSWPAASTTPALGAGGTCGSGSTPSRRGHPAARARARTRGPAFLP